MKKGLKLLIFSDIFLMTGFGLVIPILAIFIKDNLVGGTIAAAGLASALFIFVKCTLQLSFSRIFKPRHRMNLLLIGTSFVALVPFLYILSTHIWHIYLAQIFYGIGAGMASPAWMSLYTLNINRKKPGFEWSVYDVSVGLGTAIAAYVGAWAAQHVGFRPVFAVNGAMAIIAALILIRLTKEKMK